MATISNAIKTINSYESSLLTSKAIIRREIAQIKNVVQSTKAKLHQTEFLRDSLLKRLSIGLIVSTFFLEILRYLANLYQRHYAELLKTVDQDMFVRKFYISYKGSKNNEDTLNNIVSLFMTKDFSSSTNDSRSMGQEEVSIIGDLLKSIGKKL